MNVALGFIFLLFLGFTASRLALFRGRLSLGMQYIFFAGTEFLLVGLALGPQAANVLTQDVLQQLSPVLSLGLGWIGLFIGLQFDRRELIRIPPAIGWMGGIISGLTFAVIFLFLYGCIPIILSVAGLPIPEEIRGDFYRAIAGLCFILGWIGTVSTSSALSLLNRNAGTRGGLSRAILLLTEVCPPIAIGAVGLWHGLNHHPLLRYSEVERWLADSLPPSVQTPVLIETIFPITPVMSGVEWILLTVLLGIALGWMLHFLTHHRLGENEMLLLLTGAVIFSGGLAMLLRLSPLFVNLIVGITLSNLPSFKRGRIASWMLQTEKPFFVVFMIWVGAMWPPITPMVLGITFLYILMRMAGLWLSAWVAGRCFMPAGSRIPFRLGFTLISQGGVALAMAVDFTMIRPGVMADMALGIVILAILIQQLFSPTLLGAVLRRDRREMNSRLKSEKTIPSPPQEGTV